MVVLRVVVVVGVVHQRQRQSPSIANLSPFQEKSCAKGNVNSSGGKSGGKVTYEIRPAVL